MPWWSGFESILSEHAPLSEYTWYRLGGAARWLCQPHGTDQLAALLPRLADAGVPWKVLGRGANVLVRDAGFDGCVIRLAGPAFEHETIQPGDVRVGAGVDFPKFIGRTISRSLVGLEVLAGIPGTLGGVIRMNAGGKYGDIGRFVQTVTLLDTATARIAERPAAAVGFRYRHTDLDGCIVLGARLNLPPGDAETARLRHREIWREKYATQPPLAERSAGCIFKNPPQQSAGRLLDEAGLKGSRVGGATISVRHANFIVAEAGATADDVLRLIDLARARVTSFAGVDLQLEVEVW